MQLPSVSVIVCTRGRPVSLMRTLHGLALLRYPHELIIIRDPADLETAQCVARYAANARSGDCAAENLSRARNTGLLMAIGDIVAFIDDDAVPKPDWLDHIVTAYADPAIAAAGGFIRDGSGVRYQSRVVLIDPFGGDFERAAVPHALPRGWFISLTGTNFSVRRRAALALGGFDEQYTYFLEETDFLFRLQSAGGRIAVVPNAQVTHYREQNSARNNFGAPVALRSISRSKAYFCLTNRQPEITEVAIKKALQRYRRVKLRQAALNFCSFRLNGNTLKQLWIGSNEGLAEGAAAARAGRKLLEIPAG